MPRLPGKRIFVEMLIAHGTRYLFGNPGTTEQQLMDVLQDYPQLEYIMGLHESVAVGMADGYARSAGRPAVANVHIAAGLGNALSMLYDAYRGGTPLILTAGQSDTRLLMYEPTLTANLVEMARQFTKWSYEVLHAADVPQAVRRAFKVAAQPPTRPVFLSLPMDMMDDEADVEIRPLGEVATRVRPDPAAIDRAAEMFLQAESPALLLGDRVASSGAVAEVTRFAELVGARVYTLNATEVVFPTGHPLYLGSLNTGNPATREILQNFDLVLAAGGPLFQQFLYLPVQFLGPNTKVIQLDDDPWEVGKNWPIDLGIQADPKLGFADLYEAVASRMSGTDREKAAGRIAAAEAFKRHLRDKFEQEVRAVWDTRPIAPARLARELKNAVPPGTILVDEAITTSPAIQAAFDFDEPGTYFRIRGGAIGWGLPAALGVKLARPERPVVAVVGDGSAQYTIQSLWSAAHHRIPVTYVICSNRSYRILKANLRNYLKFSGQGNRQSKFIGMDLTDPDLDFAALARAYGVRGWRVESPDDLGEALRSALRADGPALVDVVLDGRL
jgi:benzoylformate decarboxylase